MNTLGQPMIVGDPLQESRELPALFLRQSGEQVFLVLAGDLANGLKRAVAFLGQTQRVAAAILAVGLAFHQAPFFQLIH